MAKFDVSLLLTAIFYGLVLCSPVRDCSVWFKFHGGGGGKRVREGRAFTAVINYNYH